MIRRTLFFVIILLATSVSLATEPSGVNPPTSIENQYVGAIVCKNCHGPTTENDPFTVWSVSKHSRTFVQLGTGYIEMIDPEAKGFVPEGFGGSIVKEARRLGVDTDCLDCHATANNRSDENKAETFHVEDGVQCETCHGPGGAHVAWMEQTDISEGQRPHSSKMRQSTLESCSQACHREKPTHSPFIDTKFDWQKAWTKIAHGQSDE